MTIKDKPLVKVTIWKDGVSIEFDPPLPDKKLDAVLLVVKKLRASVR